MDSNRISFEELPQFVVELQKEVQELKDTIRVFMEKVLEIKPEGPDDLLSIDEACKIIGLKKSTIYHKVQKGEIKSYKPQGCKILMFKRSDLKEWVEGCKRQANIDVIMSMMQSSVRHKPSSSMEGR